VHLEVSSVNLPDTVPARNVKRFLVESQCRSIVHSRRRLATGYAGITGIEMDGFDDASVGNIDIQVNSRYHS
jgi:hypothetical protein